MATTLQEYLRRLRTTGTIGAPAPRQIPAPAPVQTTATALPTAPTAISAPQPQPRQIPGAAPAQPVPTGGTFSPPPAIPTATPTPITGAPPTARAIPASAPATPVASTRAPQGTIAGEHAAPFLPTPGLTPAPPTVQQPGFPSPFPDRGGPPSLPEQAEAPAQLNIGNIIRRLMALTPRQYGNLLPSDRQRLAGRVSQLGVEPDDFFESLIRQFASGVNPGRIAFGANF